jgi:hypothetical protein
MASDQREPLLDKADGDRIFSFNRRQWTQVAPQMIAHGWIVRVMERKKNPSAA